MTGEACLALGHGVTRSKRRAMQHLRKAAEGGYAAACSKLARALYGNFPHAREIGLVAEAPYVVATPGGGMEGHDVPQDVLNSVVHWLRRGLHDPFAALYVLRKNALEGAAYCRNEGCELVGQFQDFKRCPLCKTARYCGDACQKEDWTTGEHRASCCKFEGYDPMPS